QTLFLISKNIYLSVRFKIIQAFCGRFSPAWCPFQKSLLDQIGFVDVKQRYHFFADRNRQGFKADWTATVCFYDRSHDTVVDSVKSQSVNFQHLECMVCRPERDGSILLDYGEVPYTPEETVGDTRRPPGAFFQFQCAVRVNRHFEN